MKVIFVACGGALGAVARYAVYIVLPAKNSPFPWATLAVNTSGCLLMGALMGWGVRTATPGGAPVYLLLGMGFLGAFTTFSTFGMETLALLQNGMSALAFLSIAANCLLGILAVYLGYSALT